MITFTIPGVPERKQRPRFRLFFTRNLAVEIADLVRRGKSDQILPALRRLVKISTYTPPETQAAEEAIRLQSLRHRPKKPLRGALRMDVVFVMPKPTRLDSDRSQKWPHVGVDLDNLWKLLGDAWNGVMWESDSQICATSAIKIYGSPPRTEVRISQLSDVDEAQHTLWEGIGNGW